MNERNLVLFDTPTLRQQLLPFTFTRPVAHIRIGILTLAEKWQAYLNTKPSFITDEYLSTKYPVDMQTDNLFVDAALLPNAQLAKALMGLKLGQALFKNGRALAARGDQNLPLAKIHTFVAFEFEGDITAIDRPWDIFRYNGKAIKEDVELLTTGRQSQPLDASNQVIGNHAVFLEEGAQVRCAILNTTDGPIYIGKDAEVMEGSLIRGPFALCEHSTLKMGAKIYGPTTIGPHSKVGGEVNNSVIFGYSNKAHDGFLGNSVIGEWCNLGADTNNSNLKNNYDIVKVWSYADETMVDTSLQFCGLFMGDHSKSGINTMFNTGTLVGVSANVFGGSFPNTMIPSFSWGGAGGFATYHLNKAFEVAERVMERRGIALDQVDKDILQHVFEITAKYRTSQLNIK